MASHWCRAPDEALDVAQEAVVRLLQGESLPGNVGAWLFVVTRRLSHRRHLRDVARTGAELAFAERPRHCPDLDLRIDVDTVISRLGARDRDLLTQLALGSLSREIAERLGCQVRDVGQMVARARRKARKLMEEDAGP